MNTSTSRNIKFLTKVNRNFFIILTMVLILISLTGYFILRITIIRGAKENLLNKADAIEKLINETGSLPNLEPGIETKQISHIETTQSEFNVIYIYNEQEDEMEPFLEYSTRLEINGKFYAIKLRQATFEFEDLIIILTITLFILLLTAFLISYFISKKVNKTIWVQFEDNLSAIEQYNFSDKYQLTLKKTHIEEFDRLNNVVENLTGKLRSDYDTLKEFTENASHELQTPLATISLNLEEILQQDMDSESFQKIASAMNAIKKLSRLNQSLLLLAKIENQQFTTKSTVDFNVLIKQKTEEFSVLFDTRSIEITLHETGKFMHEINDHLADILFNNLFSNAVNHNYKNGKIVISISDQQLKICNTGEPNTLKNNTIFNRFSKGNSKSYGLGLSIVKKICDTHQLTIKYVKNDMHCFLIEKSNTVKS
ncbi:sensor histidine kinase [Saccharicrinis sp. FJH62]|uniref:sensor histidine kinase n=1 Tax=Saccharicrinis sp. FJH62 TaxID=3344657 RepID=UPI0035D43978